MAVGLETRCQLTCRFRHRRNLRQLPQWISVLPVPMDNPQLQSCWLYSLARTLLLDKSCIPPGTLFLDLFCSHHESCYCHPFCSPPRILWELPEVTTVAKRSF
jgi:hypothetical protein